MQNLGATRSSRQPDHALLTPDTFVRAAWPGMTKALAIVHASPALGAGFTQYTVEFEADGRFATALEQHLIYVLKGEIELGLENGSHRLGPNMFAFLPENTAAQLVAKTASRVTVIEKPYQPIRNQSAPRLLVGDERSVSAEPLLGDEGLQVKALIPDDPAFDFAVNTMVYLPGASLPMVESHVMEHGLLMLEGGGIYRLNDKWYPVTAGDFIWMAPWCPQWFGALGKIPAKYIIYKDWNRHPAEGR